MSTWQIVAIGIVIWLAVCFFAWCLVRINYGEDRRED